MQRRHCPGSDSAPIAVTDDQTVASAQAVDERVKLGEVVAVIGVSHDYEFSVRGPYSFCAICTTRAPASRANSDDPSADPLSATSTSPSMPVRSRKRRALLTQTATVSASLRHGIRMVSSREYDSPRSTLRDPGGPGPAIGARADLRADSM